MTEQRLKREERRRFSAGGGTGDEQESLGCEGNNDGGNRHAFQWET